MQRTGISRLSHVGAATFGSALSSDCQALNSSNWLSRIHPFIMGMCIRGLVIPMFEEWAGGRCSRQLPRGIPPPVPYQAINQKEIAICRLFLQPCH